MLKKIENNSKVVDYKTRQQLFLEWLQTVVEINFKRKRNIENAILLWTEQDKQGNIKTKHARFNCKLNDYEFFKDCMKEFILNRRFDEFLREHIGDYLEYIN